MHEAKAAELPEEELIRRFAEHLPHLGRRAEEAKAIVEEIRDRSGVLVERTPGSFAFSHLTFQEYLTAQEMVKDGAYGVLLDNYKDKWWHEVIVLAAGFPSADAAWIVRGLLDEDGEEVARGDDARGAVRGDGSGTTGIAAKQGRAARDEARPAEDAGRL